MCFHSHFFLCWLLLLLTLTAPLNGFECMDTSPPSPTTEVNSCLHSWHKLIKYNNPDKKEQIWESFVSGDLFWPFFPPCADGQKRKKSLRRKLDSLAKEKSKDKGTPTSFNTHSDILPFPSASLCLQLLSRLSPSPSLPPPNQWDIGVQSVVSTPRAGEQGGYKNSFCLLDFYSLYLALVERLLVRGLALRISHCAALSKPCIFGRKSKKHNLRQ